MQVFTCIVIFKISYLLNNRKASAYLRKYLNIVSFKDNITVQDLKCVIYFRGFNNYVLFEEIDNFNYWMHIYLNDCILCFCS